MDDVTYADSTFFDLFSIPVLHGDPVNLLNQPNFIMLSKETSKRFFGEDDALAKSIIIGEESFMVSGVYDDIPDNSHFHFDILLSMPSYEDSFSQMWLSNNYHTYIQVHPTTDIVKLEKEISLGYSESKTKYF